MKRLLYKVASIWGSTIYFFAKISCTKNGARNFYLKENLISESECKQLISLIEDNDGINQGHLERNKKTSYMLRNNSIYYYDFPESVLTEYKFIPYAIQNELTNRIVLRLIPDLEDFLGTRVAIEAVDLYKTVKNIKFSHVNSKSHLDGDHRSSAKLLIYLNDIQKTGDGPLVMIENNAEKELYGDSGSGVFFYASREYHKGISPVDNDRYCLNIKFYPTLINSRLNNIENQPVNRLASLFRI